MQVHDSGLCPAGLKLRSRFPRQLYLARPSLRLSQWPAWVHRRPDRFSAVVCWPWDSDQGQGRGGHTKRKVNNVSEPGGR